MKFINLTPHDITIVKEGGNIVIPASGNVARVETIKDTVGYIDGIPIHKTRFGEVVGLPDPADDTMCIVSLATAKAASGRRDLVVTDDAVRDNNGRIIGCRALAMI